MVKGSGTRGRGTAARSAERSPSGEHLRKTWRRVKSRILLSTPQCSRLPSFPTPPKLSRASIAPRKTIGNTRMPSRRSAGRGPTTGRPPARNGGRRPLFRQAPVGTDMAPHAELRCSSLALCSAVECSLPISGGIGGCSLRHEYRFGRGGQYRFAWNAVHVEDALVHRVTQSTAEEIIEDAAAFFEDRLWATEPGARVRSRLARAGIEEATMRKFGVGYAPGDVRELLRHLREAGLSDEDLVRAGIATPSDREHLHVLFHARVMFPIRDPRGRTLGFAGLATHLGPSWPLWITSPEGDLFQLGSAIFGIERALPSIAEAGRARSSETASRSCGCTRTDVASPWA